MLLFEQPYGIDDRLDALNAILRTQDPINSKRAALEAFINEECDLLMRLTPPRQRSRALDDARRSLHSIDPVLTTLTLTPLC